MPSHAYNGRMSGRSIFFVAGVLVGAAGMLLLVRIGLVPVDWNPLPVAVFGLLLIGAWVLGRLTRPDRRRSTEFDEVTDQSSTAIQKPRRQNEW